MKSNALWVLVGKCERKKGTKGLGVVGKVIFKSLHGTRTDLNRIHMARGTER